MKIHLFSTLLVFSASPGVVFGRGVRGLGVEEEHQTSYGGFEVYEDKGCSTTSGYTGSENHEFDLYKKVPYETCESECVSLGPSCYGFEYTQWRERCEVWRVEVSTTLQSFSGKKCYIKKAPSSSATLSGSHENEGTDPGRIVDPNPKTTLGRRQAFDKNDFVFDLAGSTPESETPAGTIQPLGVSHVMDCLQDILYLFLRSLLDILIWLQESNRTTKGLLRRSL